MGKDSYIVVVTTRERATNQVVGQSFYVCKTYDLASKIWAMLTKNERESNPAGSEFYNSFKISNGQYYETAKDVPVLKDIEVLAELKKSLEEDAESPKKDKPIQMVEFRDEDIEFDYHDAYKCEPHPVSDFKTGQYVFTRDGKLGVVEVKKDGYYSIHTSGLEHGVSKDTIVYPVTLGTADVVEKVKTLREKYHRLGIMNSTFSNELEGVLDKAMLIYSDDSAESRDAWQDLWEEEEKKYEELVVHAKALHICPRA